MTHECDYEFNIIKSSTQTGCNDICQLMDSINFLWTAVDAAVLWMMDKVRQIDGPFAVTVFA